MPQVSVIIPNYNHGPFLRNRIESVLNQTLNDIELLIVDDCSTDNSRDIIKTYEHHPKVSFVFYNSKNSGSPYSQWSLLINLASADWIWVAESDDLADPQFLETLLPLAQSHKDASLVYCDSQIVYSESDIATYTYALLKKEKYKTSKWMQAYKQEGKAELNEFLKKDCTINNVSAVLFRKSYAKNIVSQLNGFRHHGDWMFYIEMAGQGEVIYHPEPLNKYREHGGNHSKKNNGAAFNKTECYIILDRLLKKEFISYKEELIRHFIKAYIGFGLIKDQPFSAKGLYHQYKTINPALARKVLIQLIKSKILPE